MVAVGFSHACVLQPPRRWEAAAGLWWPASLTCAGRPQQPAARVVETRGGGSSGNPGSGLQAAGEFGDAFVPTARGWQWRAASGFAPRASFLRARCGHGFLSVKSCAWVTGAREDQPLGPRTHIGQSWRAFSCGRCFPTTGALCARCWGLNRSLSRFARRHPWRRLLGLLAPPTPFFCMGSTRREALGRDPASL